MSVSCIAVFVAADWVDTNRLRVWAKRLAPDSFVLLTDDATDANAVLARELRCAAIVAAFVRIPGTMRSVAALEVARQKRDEYMAALAHRIVDFGEVPGSKYRFVSRVTEVIDAD